MYDDERKKKETYNSDVIRIRPPNANARMREVCSLFGENAMSSMH